MRISLTLPDPLGAKGPRGEMINDRDCYIVVSDFNPQTLNDAHFQTNSPCKDMMNPLYSLSDR